MADYYPLLARALEGVREPSPAARGVVYERARTALLTQLRSLDPPLSPAEIDRERASLDDAIARAEAAHAPPPAVEPIPLPADPAERRPFGERPLALRPGGKRGRPLLTAFALVAVIAPIAVAAWLYRDSPAAPPPAVAPSGPAPAVGDLKFTDRIGGGEVARTAAAPPAASSTPAPPASLSTVAPPAPSLPAAPAPLPVPTSPAVLAPPPVPAPLAAPPRPPDPAPVASPSLAAAPPPAPIPSPPAPLPASTLPPSEPAPAAQPAIAVAQRALVAEENAAEPGQPRISTGRAIWRSDVLSGGQGQLLDTAVRAQVDVPDAGLSLLLTLRRNRDAALPASHTMELQFTSLRAGDGGRNIRDVGRPQMRADETTTGTQVASIPVPVKENLFLIGLSDLRSDIERNTDLLLNRNWIEIPIRFADGKRAALLFEKGVSGERIVAEAFRQWSQP